MKKTILSLIIILSIFIVPLIIYIMEYSTVKAYQEKVLYNLPYPGLLPDHPLYFIKIIRDRVLDWTTRDNLKKAELYLLFSDKRIAMAQALAKKGKNKQAVETAAKAEKYFLKIPPLLTEAKKQGSGGSSGFIDRLKLSNAKHKELIEILLKNFPQGWSEAINQVLKINNQVKKALDSL